MPILQQKQSILKNIPGAPYRHIATLEKEIGMIFGVDYSTVSQSRARLKAKMKSSRNLRKQFHRIQVQIKNLPK